MLYEIPLDPPFVKGENEKITLKRGKTREGKRKAGMDLRKSLLRLPLEKGENAL